MFVEKSKLRPNIKLFCQKIEVLAIYHNFCQKIEVLFRQKHRFFDKKIDIWPQFRFFDKNFEYQIFLPQIYGSSYSRLGSFYEKNYNVVDILGTPCKW